MLTSRFCCLDPKEVTDLIFSRGRFAENSRSFLRGGQVLLDEVMMHWFSRSYRSFTKDLVFFFTQHRKFGLDITYIAQDLDKVDSVIRSMSEVFVVCSNIRHRRVWSVLRLPLDVFLLTWYHHDDSFMKSRVIFPSRRVYGYYDTNQLFGGSLVAIEDPLEEYYGHPDPVFRVPNPLRDTICRRGRVVPVAEGAPLPEAKKSAPAAELR